MRRVVVLATGLALALIALATPASAGRDHPDCRRITKQITHYEGVIEMAQDRGNDLWEQSTREHVTRLELRRAKDCPQYAEQLRERSRAAWLAYETRRAFKAAGKAVVQYFTMGAY